MAVADPVFNEAARLAVDALYEDGMDPLLTILAHDDAHVRALAVQLLRTVAKAGLYLLDGTGDADDLVADTVAAASAQWRAGRAA
jgi:hypothetical protein